MENGQDGAEKFYSDNTWNTLVAAFAITIFSSGATMIAANNEPLMGGVTLITTMAYGVAILWWCLVDARERNIPMGLGLRVVIVLFGIIALVYYLFKSRGMRQGFISTGYTFLLLIAMFIVSTLVVIIFGALTDPNVLIK
jgi:hypothetical protein